MRAAPFSLMRAPLSRPADATDRDPAAILAGPGSRASAGGQRRRFRLDVALDTTTAATRSPVTLSVVRHMSRKRSTPRIRPMPSGGTPTMPRIIAITGSEPAGTPAVPMPPRMQTNITSTCWPQAEVDAEELREEQHGHALEQRGAVLVRGRAHGQHEARDPARQLELFLGDLQRGRQRGVATTRSRTPSRSLPASRGRRPAATSRRAYFSASE